MTLLLLLLWSVRAAATILLGLFLTFALRRRSAAVRSVVLRATLLAAWLLPLAAFVAPRVELTLPEPVPASRPLFSPAERGGSEGTGAPDASPVPSLGRRPDDVVASKAPLLTDRPPHLQETPTSVPPLLLIEGAYASIALGLVLRWLVASVRLRRIARASMPTEAGVALTSRLGVPVTFGVLRPRILLPESSKSWPPARVRAAILHERAHVRRRDWAWQTLAGLFAALHWANPLAWLLSRLVRDVAEAAADDEVLGQMGPSEYARELLAVAETARPVGPALAMARRGGVRDRVVGILAANRDRRRPTFATGGLLLLVVLSASLAIAGVRRGARQTGAKTLASGVRVEIESLEAVRDDPPETHAKFQTIVNPPKADEQRVALRFRLSGRSGPEPSICLFAPRVNPGAILTSDKPRFKLAWNAPREATAQTIRLGVASGAWRVYRGPNVLFRAQASRINGHLARPLAINVAYPHPTALAGKDVRLWLLDAQGKPMAPARSEGYVQPTGAPGTTVQYGIRGVDPTAVRSLRFEYRDYETAEFSNVAVRPQTPRPVALAEIVGRDAAGNLATWGGDGKALPPTTDGNPFAGLEPEAGERLVRLRFALDGPKGAVPDVRFVVPPPAKTGAWGAVPLGTNTAMVVLRVPKGQTATDVRMGVADGPWERFDAPFVRRPYAGRLRKDLYGIEVVLPPALREEAVDLRAYAGDRKLDAYTVMDAPDGTTKTLVLQGDRQAVTRFEVWRRPYRWQGFKAVPLLPPSRPAYGPFALTDGASAELVGVWTPGLSERVWRPDGSPSELKPPGSYDTTVPIERRGVLLAFRVRGPRLGGDPLVRVLETGGFRGSNLSALAFEGSDRLVWQTTTVPIAARSADADVEFGVGGWEDGAVMARGTQLGQASWRIDGSHVVAGVRYTALTVRPHLAFGPSHWVQLTPLDAKGNTVESFGSSMGPDHTFTFSLTRPDRVARWRFESRPREVVRFRGIRLVPLP